jgi:hypothetical protein
MFSVSERVEILRFAQNDEAALLTVIVWGGLACDLNRLSPCLEC